MTENNRSYLIHFIEDLRNFQNINRKKILFPIMEKIREKSYNSERIFSSMGEDAAAIIHDEHSNEFILLTTDAITEEFSKKSPWAAGFSAVMVCADDIYACGGFPTAVSVIISSDQQYIRDQILDGVLEATHRFEIPLIRGHTSDSTSNVGVSATMVGKIHKDYYVSASGAKDEDLIVIIADYNGRVGKSSKYYWDTVTYKSKEEILKKKQIMQQLAQQKLIHSSKDISNGGIFGTLLLLLQYSKKGAIIDLELIQYPKGLITQDFSLIDFVKMYLTSAFLLTIPQSNFHKIKQIGSEIGLTVFSIGNITNDIRILLKYRNVIEEYMDLTPFI